MAVSKTSENRNDCRRLLRLIVANGSLSPTDIAAKLDLTKTSVTAIVSELVNSKALAQEKTGKKLVSFADDGFLIAVNIGVRSTQVGAAELNGDIILEDRFETPKNSTAAFVLIKKHIEVFIRENSHRTALIITVVMPGIVDKEKCILTDSIGLGWKDIDVARSLSIHNVPVVVENDAVAAANFEARRLDTAADLILVRSGTGIAVAVVKNGEVETEHKRTDLSALFGHMTIVAGGKHCECGNRGCWEKYASAASAASLYLGDRPPARGESVPRFSEIVSKAENGDTRSRRTLEKIGDHVGVGVANVVMGIGIRRVIISGRLVNGWKFLREPLMTSIGRSIVGPLDRLTVEPGSEEGAGLGGAISIAVEAYSGKLDK